MSRYLFFIPPHFGHINPTLGIGAELIARGHEVIWIGFKTIPSELIPDGGKFYLPAEFASASDVVENILGRQDEAARNTANKMIKWAFESTWLPFCELTLKYLPAILERLQPDILLHDEGLVGAAMCAHKMGVSYVTSISSAPGLYYPQAHVLLPEDSIWLTQIMTNIMQEFGIEPEIKILNSPAINIVYTAKAFVNGELFPDQYKFVGPALEHRLSPNQLDASLFKRRKSTIYVSTGSLLKDVKGAFYAKVIAAFANEDITVLVTAAPDLFEQWPQNFEARAFWPQLEVLKNVDAVVTPGGFNTINESLYFGRPLLVIPMANDQFGNGILVEGSGCGIRLRYRRLTAEQLKESVFNLLSDKKYLDAAMSMSQSLRNGGGGHHVADLLEKLNGNVN